MFRHHTKKDQISQSKNKDFNGKFFVWKNRSETLAELLERFREKLSIDKNIKLTYAGRLDPLAEGLVLILAGEDRFDKEKFLKLNKKYIVEALIGFSSDTLDTLGIVDFKFTNSALSEQGVVSILKDMKKISMLDYPLYSSATVSGKPLYEYARSGTTVNVPHRKVKVFSAKLLSIGKKNADDLITKIIEDIKKVKGDFRQEEIIENWQKIKNEKIGEVSIISIEVEASSGTYMRTLAKWLGEKLGTGALAYSIKRVALGEYEAEELKEPIEIIDRL